MEYKHLIPAIDEWLAAQRDNYINDLIESIGIRSVATPGEGGYTFGTGCAQMLDWMLEKGRQLGVETENDEYYCGSLIYRGSGDQEAAFVGHLDVVPEGTGWTITEPYKGVYIDGHIVGRGAGDNKCSCIALYYMLKYLKEHDIKLKHSIRVLYGCQEESGMTDMPYFVEKHKDNLPELFLVCDCPFPIHHGEMGRFAGEISTDLSGSRVVAFESDGKNGGVPADAAITITGISPEEVCGALDGKDVTVTENPDGTVTVSARGKSGHPAAAEQGGSVNAIAKLCAAVAHTGILDEKADRALAFLGEAFKDFRGTGFGVACTDFSGSTQVHARSASLKDGVLTVPMSSRFAISVDKEQMFETYEKVCAEHGYRFGVASSSDPWYVPLDWRGGLPQKLTDLAIDVLNHPEIDFHPMILPAGTYAPTLPNSIGFGPGISPEIIPIPKYGYAHGPNESQCVDEMLDAIRAYIVAAIKMDELLDGQ